jgi:hypothetical protein
MSQLPDRDGRFRGYPQEWGIQESNKSQSVAFSVLWRLTEFYDPAAKQWCEYASMAREITSFTYFVKADGTPSPNGVEQLQRALGWAGDLIALQTADWTKQGAQLTIEWDTFNNKTKLKVQWLDAWDATPGRGVQKLDSTKLSALQGKLGGQLRAMSPQVQGGPPPGGRPAPPPPPAMKPVGAAAVPENSRDVSEEDIPF